MIIYILSIYIFYIYTAKPSFNKMGSTCSCLKNVKEPLNIKNSNNSGIGTNNNLKSVYPANPPFSSKKNSDIPTKENLNLEEGSVSNHIPIDPNYKLQILEQKPEKLMQELFSEKFKNKPNKGILQNNESLNLQLFNNFTEPMVKLVKICKKNDVFKESDYENSFEMDENTKTSTLFRFEEVAP